MAQREDLLTSFEMMREGLGETLEETALLKHLAMGRRSLDRCHKHQQDMHQRVENRETAPEEDRGFETHS